MRAGDLTHYRRVTVPEPERIRRLLDTLRDPNEPLPQRLQALSQLDGRKGLTPHQADSVAIHKAVLSREVAKTGHVEAGPEVWFTTPEGALRSRMR